MSRFYLLAHKLEDLFAVTSHLSVNLNYRAVKQVDKKRLSSWLVQVLDFLSK